MHVNVIIDKVMWKIRVYGVKNRRKKERRRDKMVYVMWSFMFGAVLPQMLLQ